jgi:tetratricopeptide (TPR) repeat protein
VKRKPRFDFIFSFCLFLFASTFAASTEARPITTTQLVAWLAGGVPNSRLVRLVDDRGIANSLSVGELRDLKSAGADANLIHALNMSKAQSGAPSHPITGAAIAPELLKAAVAAHEQKYHDAELELRKALESDPQNAALHFALGAMLRQQEQWDEAYDEVAQSTRLMPDFPENHNNLAYIFYRIDDGPNSIAEARTALSIDPQNSEAYQFLGLGLYSTGQYEAAVHAYAESLAREANNPDTYYDMGIALYADGVLPAAVTAYNKAIRLRPAFWEAHSNLALILHEEGKLKEAIAEYREAKRIAPEQASIRNNLGNTYCDQGDFDAAVAELRELYREHPEWQQGHACMASAYMAKRNYHSAVQELHLAVQENPTGSTEHRILGQALSLDNQPEEALREFRLAVSLNPDSDTAHHYLGTALFQQQLLPAAEKEFREALRLSPSADNHYALAACLMSQDRFDEALAELEVASMLDPEKPLYRARREELLKLMKAPNVR